MSSLFSCQPSNVTVDKNCAVQVSVQPFSLSSVKHAPTHYVGGNDALDHNQISGLQGGVTNEYYHLDAATYRAVSSGIASFSVDLPVGINSTGVLFPKTFSTPPVVIANILSPYNYTYLTSISSITTTGFNINFSSSINNTGFKLLNLAYTV